jgi:hypothetical protein
MSTGSSRSARFFRSLRRVTTSPVDLPRPCRASGQSLAAVQAHQAGRRGEAGDPSGVAGERRGLWCTQGLAAAEARFYADNQGLAMVGVGSLISESECNVS